MSVKKTCIFNISFWQGLDPLAVSENSDLCKIFFLFININVLKQENPEMDDFDFFLFLVAKENS